MSESESKSNNTFRNILIVLCIFLIGYIFVISNNQKDLRREINKLNAQNIILKTEKDKIENSLNVCNDRMEMFQSQMTLLSDRICSAINDCDEESVENFTKDMARMMHQVMTIGRMVLIGF